MGMSLLVHGSQAQPDPSAMSLSWGALRVYAQDKSRLAALATAVATRMDKREWCVAGSAQEELQEWTSRQFEMPDWIAEQINITPSKKRKKEKELSRGGGTSKCSACSCDSEAEDFDRKSASSDTEMPLPTKEDLARLMRPSSLLRSDEESEHG